MVDLYSIELNAVDTRFRDATTSTLLSGFEKFRSLKRAQWRWRGVCAFVCKSFESLHFIVSNCHLTTLESHIGAETDFIEP